MWHKTPIDRLVELARRLRPYEVGFTASMQEMLLDGKIAVRIVTPAGNVERTKDTRVFDFDDPVLKPQELYELLPNMGALYSRE